jgi:diadenosine tetraphosphate (Ap4A) HIT family hydrolase
METEKSFAFLDINPLSHGHALVIPKYHAAKLHSLPDDSLADVTASSLDNHPLIL